MNCWLKMLQSCINVLCSGWAGLTLTESNSFPFFSLLRFKGVQASSHYRFNRAHSRRNSDQSRTLQKEFWPLPPTPEGILTNRAHSRRNSDQSYPLQNEFWPIVPTPEGILTNPTHSIRNSDQSHPLQKEFWPIPPTPEAILTSRTHSRRNSDPSHWQSWQIQPTLAESLTKPTCSHNHLYFYHCSYLPAILDINSKFERF